MNKMSNPQPFRNSTTPDSNQERSTMMKTVLRALFSRRKFTVLAVVMALTLGSASAALAGSGIGGVFNLGVTNTVNAITKLTGSVAGPSLQIINNSTNAAATALNLQVATGKPPLKVNSTTKVANLNADSLDGQDSSAFANSTHTHSGEQINSGTVEADRIEDGPGSNLNADQLDGLDSSAFGIKTAHNVSFTDECDTPNTFNECAPIAVTVPAGKTYLVSVWSSFTARGGASNQDVTFCSAKKDPGQTTPSCITPFGAQSMVTIEANQLGAAAASGETVPLSGGTYVFSTAIKPTAQFTFDNFGRVITKVLVRDASGATVSSASVSEQGAALRER
jgi:hypothetical protein